MSYMPKIPVQIYFEPETLAELDERAEARDENRGQIVRLAVHNYLPDNEL